MEFIEPSAFTTTEPINLIKQNANPSLLSTKSFLLRHHKSTLGTTESFSACPVCGLGGLSGETPLPVPQPKPSDFELSLALVRPTVTP